MDGLMDGWINGRKERWMNGCMMDGWKDGWKDGWIDGWIEVWMDG